MKTLPLILLLGAVLAALYMLYLRREGRQQMAQIFLIDLMTS